MKDSLVIDLKKKLIPVLSKQEIQEVHSYFSVYMKYEKEISEKTWEDLKSHHVFGKLISYVSKEVSVKRNLVSNQLLKDAIENNNWLPYIESQVEKGIAYAEMGFDCKSRYELMVLSRNFIMDLLQKEFENSKDLYTAINGMNRLMDVAMSVIGEVCILQKAGNQVSSIKLQTINKKLEKKLIDRNLKLESMNKELVQFAHIASHDLQEPLRTVSNYATLLREQLSGKMDRHSIEFLSYINAATRRMQTLIHHLLEYSRLGSEKIKTEVNCNNVFHDVLSDLDAAIKESGAEILSEKLPVIKGYYSEIRSLFQNLISNALKFRKINIPVIITVTAIAQKNKWLFSIADNGIGIEEQYHKRIFIIFQKLHSLKQYAGTGIGLAYCKKIVELHGGKIWVESIPDKGSTFYFTLSKSRIK